MKILIYLAFISFSVQLCENSKIIVSFDVNESLAEKFPWVVIIQSSTLRSDNMDILGYGSLLHPRLVMTAASILNGKQPHDLQVHADCYMIGPIFSSCKKVRNVLELTYVEEVRYDDYILDHDYGFLLLKKSFELNDKIGTINLVKKDDYYSQYECVIFSYSWLSTSTGSPNANYLAPFKATINDKYIDIYRNYDPQIKNDEGKILGVNLDWKANFLGSPVACKLLKNPNQYVQVSISRLIIQSNHGNDFGDSTEAFLQQNSYSLSISRLRDEIDYILNTTLFNYGINKSGNINIY